MSWEDFDWLMNINSCGVAHGTKAFLPDLIDSGDGHMVNVSSVFGLVGIPSQSAYNAAKFAVRGVTEALRQELNIARHPVGGAAMSSRVHTLEVVEVIKETGEAVSLVFAVPEQLLEHFRYHPGQFLTVEIPSDRSGEVRMRRNDTLVDADLALGLTLACQAVPVSERVEIAFDQ